MLTWPAIAAVIEEEYEDEREFYVRQVEKIMQQKPENSVILFAHENKKRRSPSYVSQIYIRQNMDPERVGEVGDRPFQK